MDGNTGQDLKEPNVQTELPDNLTSSAIPMDPVSHQTQETEPEHPTRYERQNKKRGMEFTDRYAAQYYKAHRIVGVTSLLTFLLLVILLWFLI